jgi:hypothetical protein
MAASRSFEGPVAGEAEKAIVAFDEVCAMACRPVHPRS